VPREGQAADRARTGRAGEDAAVSYLERHNCTIVARNWQAHPGEVDIVALCPCASDFKAGETELAFVEVRTRHGESGLAEESLSRRKAASMASAAYSYMEAHGLDPESTPWRIDLLGIAMSGTAITSINWIKGALDESAL
jgi:putative endonuclease